MNFIIYDIALLVAFIIFVSVFLYKRKKNLKKEGLLWLYKTGAGIKVINRIGEKYKKTLNVLSYISICLGFLLMAIVLYFFGRIVWLYVFHSEITNLVKIPPIMPLLPYLPQVFKLSYLPPFYFIYWILIIAIVAISHEFSHGIFARNKNVKIKSTGFGFFPFFFPVFLAAFVELDEKNMEKKKISHQMAILSAGTFANTIIAFLSLGILILFFYLAFTPSGVVFDGYTYSAIGISAITSVNNISVNNVSYNQLLSMTNISGLSEIKANGTDYLASETFLESQGNNQAGYLFLYDDAPAVKANLSNTIIKINGVPVDSRIKLGQEIMKYSPGQKITVTGLEGDAYRDYYIVLAQNPQNKSLPYLGVGFLNREGSGILNKIVSTFSSFRNPNVYYASNFDAAEFIYDFLWWLVMISFSVALVNMLPVGIFDGGRFFYLAILAVTKKEEVAKKTFKAITYLFLFLLAVIMVFWAIGLFK
jgi:membrane-associated protease RseP (regulator of RpoE activity)